jgi:hypothetical protein
MFDHAADEVVLVSMALGPELLRRIFILGMVMALSSAIRAAAGASSRQAKEIASPFSSHAESCSATTEARR